MHRTRVQEGIEPVTSLTTDTAMCRPCKRNRGLPLTNDHHAEGTQTLDPKGLVSRSLRLIPAVCWCPSKCRLWGCLS